MNTTEYRQKSAEALNQNADGTVGYHVSNGIKTYSKNWQPDIDANQALMVLDWLRDQGEGAKGHTIVREKIIIDGYLNLEEDLRLAIGKAFMEYINQ